MNNFKGFSDSENFTQVPDSFFRLLLKEIKDTDELKVTLYAIWWIDHTEGPFRALCETDFASKELGLSAEEISHGLEKAVKRGSILQSQHEADVFYFLNSARGRATAEAFAKGQWRKSGKIMSALPERPNIFKLYEENVGPLTPLIADMLKEAEELYTEEWFEEAFTIAVKNNKRNWRYVEAILKRWKEDGKNERKDQQNTYKNFKRYTEGEFDEYFKRD